LIEEAAREVHESQVQEVGDDGERARKHADDGERRSPEFTGDIEALSQAGCGAGDVDDDEAAG
jgi:hypothetical protein